jgi:hypothetical protein
MRRLASFCSSLPLLGLSPVGDVASAVENASAAYSATTAAPHEYLTIRVRARGKHFKAMGERASAMALYVLDFLRVTRLEGKTHTLKKRKCPPSVKILEEGKIPAAYKHITITPPLPQWETLLRSAPEHLQQSVVASIQKQEFSTDLEAIKQALNLEKEVDGADLVVNKLKLQVG